MELSHNGKTWASKEQNVLGFMVNKLSTVTALMSPLNDRLESKYNVFEVSSKKAALNSKISFIKCAALALALES